MNELLKAKFGELFQKDLLDEIADHGTYKMSKPGTKLIDFGKYIKSIPLLLDGAIRVMRQEEQGNELFLYYLEGGDTCAMSMTCCMQRKKSQIKAIAETDVEMIMIPLNLMDEWMRFADWRQFVFNSYNSRFEEILSALDSVAFLNLDERLMNYLLDIKQNTGSFEISRTHQELANDLGTSRVVISRLLKKLEKEERIELHRNLIVIL